MPLNRVNAVSYPGYSLNIPREIINREKDHALLSPLLPLETGLFERALGHGIFRRGLNEYILIYCVDGRGYLELDGVTHEADRGTLLICPPELSHRYWADPHAPWSIYWVHVRGSSLPALCLELEINKENPCLKPGVDGELIKDFLELSRCFRKGHGFPHLYETSAAMQKLFSRLIILKSYATSWEGSSLNMEEVLIYLNENLEVKMTLDKLATHTGLSKYHLSRKFKDASGYSPMAYFTQLKIQKACELLDTTNKSIKEISGVLAFNTPCYFSETFKRITGYSPVFYRRERLSLGNKTKSPNLQDSFYNTARE